MTLAIELRLAILDISDGLSTLKLINIMNFLFPEIFLVDGSTYLLFAYRYGHSICPLDSR